MDCCQCQGIEELFSQEYVNKELGRYRAKGPIRTTRMLIEAIKKEKVDGLTLLDIGGGVGAVHQELLKAGARSATDVDASSAYLAAARSEAQQRGSAERVNYQHGNFVELAANIAPADIVTLDRVICCFDNMEELVGLSAQRAQKLYGLVYPRDTWWVKLGIKVENFTHWLSGNPFRAFVHPSRAVEEIVEKNGLKRRSHSQTLAWQVVVYSRE
ncbi:MAG TPA: methyltransferase domain-containing protein [Anaerolineales bacterium]|jgi:magnesium-protoporphyrin O-methyltransferase